MPHEIFRLAVEAFPNGMVMADESGNILMVNAELERQFGYDRDELLGETVEVLIPERFRARHSHHRETFTRTAKARKMGTGMELFGRRKDGSEFPVEVALNPIQFAERLLIVGAVVDISERKRAERLKDEFVATVSHELRTPMTSLAGSLGLLVGQWSDKMPAPAARLLVIAQSNAQRLVRLINDILDIEKAESGSVAFAFKRIDAVELIEQVIECNRTYATSYNVHVRIESDSDHIEITTDADRLAQIVTNLLSNAIKFSPPDAEVVVTLKRRAGGLRLSVRDWGPGIPDDFKPHVFEKFAQADATNARQKGGTGLGLSIVKQLVDLFGGKVGFSDALDGGTIFFVELPDHEGHRPRILHLDDDQNVLALVRVALSDDADVISVDSLEMARIALQTNQVDLAVLDIAVGNASGLDLMPQLRDATGNIIPVIVFSQVDDLNCDGQIGGSLPKGRTSLDDLVDAVRDRLLPPTTRYIKEVA
ncbi:ATP-binding protein [Terrihabitans soli]|uniref:ATP-binding response regulator n=1 Tax=Terrihabitans soli TaxID=708113 RepID=UPI001CA37C59|nr:ATP-binding protein [Terrihabitans soli]